MEHINGEKKIHIVDMKIRNKYNIAFYSITQRYQRLSLLTLHLILFYPQLNIV